MVTIVWDLIAGTQFRVMFWISVQPQPPGWCCGSMNGSKAGCCNRGDFHFIYDNTVDKLTPSQVKLYIETDGEVTIGTDMALNQGELYLSAKFG